MTSQPIYQSPDPDDSILLSSPAQVAASIPYTLGFWPQRSVVGMFFDDANHMVLTARLDLTDGFPRDDLLASFSGCCTRASAQGATQAFIAAFPDEQMSSSEKLSVLYELDDLAQMASLDVLGVGSVVDGHWVGLISESYGCPIDETSDELLAACQWVTRGIAYAPDRDALAGAIVGAPTALSLVAQEMLESGEFYNAAGCVRTRKQRREIEDKIFEFVTRVHPRWVSGRSRSELPASAEDIINWAHALKDRRVREPVLWRIALGDDGNGANARDAAAGFSALTRNTPDQVAGAVASCTAAVAWQSGNGALARIAAEHGLNCEPRNVLSGLVISAVSNGVHPSVWIDMLRSMPLGELRATVMKRQK